MPGHRRISTDLFLQHIDRTGTRSKVEALLELDLDDWKGTRRSIRAYARLWRWSREKVAALVAEYDAHLEDLGNREQNTPEAAPEGANRAENHPATNRPPDRPQTSQAQGQESAKIPGASVDRLAGKPATNRPPDRPQTGHFLEPEPTEPEERGVPPRAPSALREPKRIGPAESRRRAMSREVALALERVQPDRRAEVRPRLEILAECFAACSRIADDAQLRAYYRATWAIPTELLERACDAARLDDPQGRGFPPPADRIRTHGRRLVVEARKRARGEG